MKKIKLAISLIAISTLMFLSALYNPISLATETPTDPCSAGIITNPDYCSKIPQSYSRAQSNKLVNIAADVAKILLTLAGILAIIMIIISAIRIVASAGNTEKVNKAKRNLLWSIIGLIIALLASVIVNLVVNSAVKLK